MASPKPAPALVPTNGHPLISSRPIARPLNASLLASGEELTLRDSLNAIKSHLYVNHSEYRVPIIPMPPDTDPPKESSKDMADSTFESLLMATEVNPHVAKSLTAFARASSPADLDTQDLRRKTGGSGLWNSPLSGHMISSHAARQKESVELSSAISEVGETKMKARQAKDKDKDKGKEAEALSLSDTRSHGEETESLAISAARDAEEAVADIRPSSHAMEPESVKRDKDSELAKTSRKKKPKKPSARSSTDSQQDDEAFAADAEKRARKAHKSRSSSDAFAKPKHSYSKSKSEAAAKGEGDDERRQHRAKKHASKSDSHDKNRDRDKARERATKRQKKIRPREKHDEDDELADSAAAAVAAFSNQDEAEREKTRLPDDEQKEVAPLISLSPLSELTEARPSPKISPGKHKPRLVSTNSASSPEGPGTTFLRDKRETVTSHAGAAAGLSFPEPDALAFSGPDDHDLGPNPDPDPNHSHASSPPPQPQATGPSREKTKKKKRCCLLLIRDKLFKGKKRQQVDGSSSLQAQAQTKARESETASALVPLKQEEIGREHAKPEPESSGFRLKRNKFILLPPELEDEMPDEGTERKSIQGKEEMLSDDDLRRKRNAGRMLVKRSLASPDKSEPPTSGEQQELVADQGSSGTRDRDADPEAMVLRASLLALEAKVDELEKERAAMVKEKESIQVVNKKLLQNLDSETGGRLKKSRSLEKLASLDRKGVQKSSFSGAIEDINDHLEKLSSSELEIESLKRQVQALIEKNAELAEQKRSEVAAMKGKFCENQEELHAIYELLVAAQIISLAMVKDHPDRRERLEVIERCIRAFRQTSHYLFQFTEPEEEEAQWISVWANAYENVCPSDAWMERVVPDDSGCLKEMDDDPAFRDMQELPLIPSALKDSLVDEMVELKKREFLIEQHLSRLLKNDPVLTEKQLEMIKEIEQIKQTHVNYWNELKSLSAL